MLRLADEKVMKDLLFMDTLRGPHSTGFTQISTVVKSVKAAIPGTEFVKDVDFLRAINGGLAWCWVGHNRWATMGAKTAENAHPFSYGDIHLAHNGTLDRHDNLPEGKSFIVDSRAVTNAFNVWGAKKTVRELDGAFALSWFDEKDNTVNFVRNDERPLFIGFNKKLNIILWASEEHTLRGACKRQKTEFELDEVFSLPVGKHYKYEIGTGKFKCDEPVIEDFELMPFSEKQGGSWFNSYNRKPYTNHSTTYQNVPAKKNPAVAELESAGYAEQEIIPVIFNSFVPFPSHASRGTYIGKIQSDTDCEMEVRVIADHPASTLSRTLDIEFGTVVHAKVISCFTSYVNGGSGVKVASCTSDVLRTYAEWEEQEEHKEHAGTGGVKNDVPPFPVVQDQQDSQNQKWKNTLMPSNDKDTLPTDTGATNSVMTPIYVKIMGKTVPRKRYLEIIEPGCSICDQELLTHVPEQLYWFDSTTPCCSDCVDDFKLQ